MEEKENDVWVQLRKFDTANHREESMMPPWRMERIMLAHPLILFLLSLVLT